MIILQRGNVERLVTSVDEAAKLEAAGFERVALQETRSIVPQGKPPAASKETAKAPVLPAKGNKGKKSMSKEKTAAATAPPAQPSPKNGGGADGAESAGTDNEGCASHSETTS